ncbi:MULTISPECIES: hypothetical protein [Pseudomonas]|uniref:hypothetical protein n=1 Tax=Pseudomonas TaxID=286 RepID=UPI001BEACF12|nr:MULTISPECIES: hypothetical protein [Pseudomonas]MBT2342118.1 hypothetical protein [Pseudomonas fluorescens]MCD4528728.1 hypothetical protein [Pseudomonas sp. C3-2018]
MNLLDDFYGKSGSMRRLKLAANGPAKLVGTMPWQVPENLVEGFLEGKKIFYFFKMNFLFYFCRLFFACINKWLAGLFISKLPTVNFQTDDRKFLHGKNALRAVKKY